jgi:hypothetical protein
MRNKGVGVTVADLVLGLEESDLLGVLLYHKRINDLEPVRNGLSVGLLDRRKVRSRPLGFCIGSNGNSSQSD